MSTVGPDNKDYVKVLINRNDSTKFSKFVYCSITFKVYYFSVQNIYQKKAEILTSSPMYDSMYFVHK